MSSSTHSRRMPAPASRQLLTLATVAFLIFQQLVLIVPTVNALTGGGGSISLTALGSTYTQNFDTLTNTPDATLSSVLPTGWLLDESGTSARNDGKYAVGTGSSNTADCYAYGSVAGNTDRALGMLRSGTLTPVIGASFTNNTGGVINSLNISYTGEQWRFGGTNNGRNNLADRLDFQYSLNATSLTSGSWSDVDQLDFAGPTPSGSTGGNALSGNLAANRTALGTSITGLSIPAGATFFIRWTDFDVTGADDGLSVDDFSITPAGTIILTPTNPTATGSANPATVLQGGTTVLTVSVSPGTNPTSASYIVTGDLSAIGGSSTQPFSNNGNSTFSFNATVAANTTTGAKSLPITVTDDQGRPASASIALNVQAPSGTHIVISQVYGGGGNSGATYKNDFIELYNPTANPISVSGWSVQYASSGGSTWALTDLSGTIAPGQYYLIQEAAGAGGTTNLPTPNAIGNLAMGATAGKVGLVANSEPLGGSCPSDPDLIDFVGYGSAANCFEGAGPTATLTNTTATLRKNGGDTDTNNNNADFTTGAPNPRFTPGGVSPGGETAPFISATTPGKFGTNVLVDSNITINFNEPVSVSGNWFSISCPTSGTHTATVTGGPTSFKLDPTDNFANGEQCTVNVTANLVSDVDTNDPPDHMLTDYSWTFTTISSSGVVRNPDEHLTMGIPSNATADTANENDYLMKKPEYALSYNRSRAIPNWTSWHLDNSWRGSQPRTNLFRADPDLPTGWYQVNETSFSGTGFDRGHMCPSADRTFTYEENAATFLMTNMVPQAPDNNQVTWEGLESYARTLVDAGNEVYIISGGYGQGGIGNNSSAVVNTVDQGRVVVPAKTWKVLLVLPAAEGDDVARVTTSTRTIGVIMPNEQGINSDWHNYIVSVDEVEALTGYNFFSNVPGEIQAVIEANADGNTRPVANNQSVTTQEDTSRVITLTATDAESNPLTYNVTGGPSHGTVSSIGNSVTYTPAADYYGPDSFTFTASDKYLNSQAATVTINVTAVNDAPVVVNDDKSTPEDTALIFPATDLTANDSAGANEGDQTLTVTGVVLTPNTHGTIALISGQVTYTPDHNYNGPASFDYQVCDNGTPTALCGNGTVNITVTSVNDNPNAVNDSAITDEDTPVTIDVIANDTDEDGGTPALDSVGNSTNGSVSVANGKAVFSPDLNFHGVGGFSYVVRDGQGGTATGNVTVTINPVNDAPVANADSATTDEDTAVAIDARANDTDVDGDGLSITNATNGAHGTVAVVNGSAVYTPAENYHGPDNFTYTVSDGHGGSAQGAVSVTVNSVNDNPVAVNDSATTAEDNAVTIDAVANDTDVDGDPLTLTSVSNANGGTVSIVDGKAVFNPNHNYNGSGTFTYTAGDGHGGEATATVTVTITPVNDDPVANSDSAVTNEDNAVVVDARDNDSDVDGDGITITSVSGASKGTAELIASGPDAGKVRYTPNLNENGADSFTYTLSDGQGGTTTGNVSVTINPVNDGPTANAQSVSTTEESAAAITLTGSDVETSAANLSFEVVSNPSHGTLSGTGANLTYTPAANYNGSDSFTFKVTDTGDGTSAALSSEATVSINVTAVNDTPTANSQSAATNEDTPKLITLSGSDVETPAGSLIYTVTTNPSHGTLTGTAPNLTYVPNLNYNGPDSFQFTVTDTGDGSSGALTSAPGSVSINVSPVNDDPVANAGPDQTLECAGGLTAVMLNGSLSSDLDGDTLTYEWREGTTVLGTGAILNTSRVFGAHTITLKVTDPSGAVSEDAVGVNIIDTTAPTLTSNGQAFLLWPLDKKYHTFNVSDLVASASDSCNTGVNLNSVVIQKVTSDEGSISGNDIIIAANCQSVQLRADRNGSGNGRVYTITFKVSDAAGNTTTLTRQVVVPHDQGNGNSAIDSGVAYTVTSSCQ
ncbi:MAG: hypothetical protein QOJ02_3465 [Acidobacteriota bacterium]|nr:hypothetical protein [Acidobacteriota bacterium]